MAAILPAGSHDHPMAPRHDRTYLLSESKRNDVLALLEVERYGRDSFGDPDYVSVYGLKPAEWHALGVRSLEDVRHRRARPQPRLLLGTLGWAP